MDFGRFWGGFLNFLEGFWDIGKSQLGLEKQNHPFKLFLGRKETLFSDLQGPPPACLQEFLISHVVQDSIYDQPPCTAHLLRRPILSLLGQFPSQVAPETSCLKQLPNPLPTTNSNPRTSPKDLNIQGLLRPPEPPHIRPAAVKIDSEAHGSCSKIQGPQVASPGNAKRGILKEEKNGWKELPLFYVLAFFFCFF